MNKTEAIKILQSIKVKNNEYSPYEIGEAIVTAVEELQNQPKQGKWIEDFKCSECGNWLEDADGDIILATYRANKLYPYCPFCGAKMDEQREDGCVKTLRQR